MAAATATALVLALAIGAPPPATVTATTARALFEELSASVADREHLAAALAQARREAEVYRVLAHARGEALDAAPAAVAPDGLLVPALLLTGLVLGLAGGVALGGAL
jgi:NADPH:quinone reductase-like Zn-dependent oxidoreductase